MTKKKESAPAREKDMSSARRKALRPESGTRASSAAPQFEADQQGTYRASSSVEAVTGASSSVPSVLPPGTLVVVPSSASPPPAAPQSVTRRSYDFVPSAPVRTDSAPPQPVTPAPAAPPVKPAAFQGGNVSATTVTPPARPTSIVPPSTPAPAAPRGTASSITAPGSQDSAPTQSPAAPVIVSPSRVSPAVGSSIPTPPSVFSPGGNLASQGTIIAEVLRMAAQSGVERDAAEQAAARAREKFVIDDAKVKALRESLYNDVADLFTKATGNSSPAVAEYSLDALRKARLMIVASASPDDLTQAEYLVERVRGRLNRAGTMVPPGQFWNMVAILAWSFIFFLVCLPLAISFLYPEDSIRFVNLTFKKDAIPFLAAFGWGGIGGVIGVFYNMTYFVQQREYDPAYNLDYIVRPIKGFMVGGILMLISAFGSGSFGAPNNTAASPMAFGLVYLIAVLGGFKQEVIFDWFDAILKAALRTTSVKPTAPGESAPPK